MTATAPPRPGDGALAADEPGDRHRGPAGEGTQSSGPWQAAGLVLAGLLAGIVAAIAGPLGTKALIVAAGLVLALIGLWAARRTVRWLRPGATMPTEPRVADPPPHRSSATPVLVPLAALVAGMAAVVAASAGMKLMLAVAVVLAGTIVAFAYRRELRVVLVGAAPEATPAWAPTPLLDLSRNGRRDAPRPTLSRPLAFLTTIALVGTAVVVAWLAASLGLKGPLAVIAVIVGVGVFVYLRPRRDALLFLVPCSFVLFLHKSIGGFHLVNSGAPAIYITSLGVITVVLYVMWVRDGTMRADLRAAWQPALWIPLVGVLTLLPSLLPAPQIELSIAELVRMAWMYALYVYLAARIRRQAQIALVLVGLAIFAVVELVVVLLQWKTGGVLGLSFLGVPTELGERVIDVGSIGRPFGTIVHPVFLGATMGALALLFLSVGISVKDIRLKWACFVLTAVSAAPIAIAETRAALMAFVPVALLVVIVGVVQRKISGRSIRIVAGIGLVVTVACFPVLKDKYDENFGTSHFSLEVESRVQLNDLAWSMIDDHPEVGVGLNNFQVVQPRYDNYGLLFAGNPVHNLYLLQIAETGYLGLAGLLLVGGVLLVVAVRLARAREPLLSGMGTAMAAVLAFFAIEELLGFSLRQEIPLALFWLLAGLTVAASTMSTTTRQALLPAGAGRPGAAEQVPPSRLPARRPTGAAPRRTRTDWTDWLDWLDELVQMADDVPVVVRPDSLEWLDELNAMSLDNPARYEIDLDEEDLTGRLGGTGPTRSSAGARSWGTRWR